jgi:hypothetical protein
MPVNINGVVVLDGSQPFSEVHGQCALSDPARYARYAQGGQYFDQFGVLIDGGYLARRSAGMRNDPGTRTRPDGS